MFMLIPVTVFGKGGILCLHFRKTGWHIASFTLEQMYCLFYLYRASINLKHYHNHLLDLVLLSKMADALKTCSSESIVIIIMINKANNKSIQILVTLQLQSGLINPTAYSFNPPLIHMLCSGVGYLHRAIVDEGRQQCGKPQS